MTAAVSLITSYAADAAVSCKQSFRAVVIECPKYLSKRSRKGAEKKRENGAEPETAEIPLEQRAHFYT